MFDVMFLGCNCEGSEKSEQDEGSAEKYMDKAEGILNENNMDCFIIGWSNAGFRTFPVILKVLQNLGQVKLLPMSLLKVIPNSSGFFGLFVVFELLGFFIFESSLCIWVAAAGLLLTF